jgi:uncharacterized caspase-like protein
MVLGLFCLIAALLPARAEEATALKGVALAIGQSDYAGLSDLPNPAVDADKVGQLLKSLGFETASVTNADRKKFDRALDRFAEDAEGADVALLYYAGHAIEAAGENWLIPSGAGIGSLAAADRELVKLSGVLAELRSKARVVIILVDACRSNPFPADTMLSVGGAPQAVALQGLALPRGFLASGGIADGEALGTVIGFAAAPGGVALDGKPGAGSPYAAALLRHLATPGADFSAVMTMVAEEVYLETGGRQQPWTNASLRRLLYFGKGAAAADADEARLDRGRRELLLTIASLPEDTRRSVEALAAEGGLPLAPLYGMLGELKVDTSAGPAEIDRQLRAGAESLRRILAERDAIARTDPGIARLTELGDRAVAQGALALAQDYRAEASALAEKNLAGLEAAESRIDERFREAAATFANEAKTAVLAFEHAKAAAKFALAHRSVDGRDARLARLYKWSEADALQSEGDYKGDNGALEAAVVAYRSALGVTPRNEFHGDWPSMTNQLGLTLRILGEREGGTARLEEAAEAFRAALAAWPREQKPLDWARAMNNLGNTLVNLGIKERGPARLEEGIAAYRAALEAGTRELAPVDWAATQNNLGVALKLLGERETGTARLEQAVDAYRAALLERTRGRNPIDWATTQNNLASALSALGARESGSQLLEEAALGYRAVLEEWTRERVPLSWALAQNNLGIVLMDLGNREKDPARLLEAVEAYRSALLELTRDRVPLDWAMAQSNLAIALQTLGERENSTSRLEESVAAYRGSLEEWTRERVPHRWARTQNNLGNALSLIGRREKGNERLEAAVRAYRAALDEWKRDREPFDWAMAQNNLGVALKFLGERENGTARLEEAVKTYRAALQEWTRERAPRDWARVQANLGDALVVLGEREGGTKRFEEAVAAYRAALEERTRERWPIIWAETQNNLGGALWRLGERSGSAELVERGKAAVQAAWEVYRAEGYGDYDNYFAERVAAVDRALQTIGE